MLPNWEVKPGPLTLLPCMLLSDLIPLFAGSLLIYFCSVYYKDLGSLSSWGYLLLDFFLFSRYSVESTELISI